jgi:hypothetical protein
MLTTRPSVTVAEVCLTITSTLWVSLACLVQLSETDTEELGRPTPLIQNPATVSDLKSISSSSILANYLPKKYFNKKVTNF